MRTPTWNIRTEMLADRDAVHDIVAAAFDTGAEAELVDALRADPAWIPALSLVAVDEFDTPIGHVLLTRNHIGATPALCLAPVSVLPDHQNRGMGDALTRAGLAVAAARGEQFVTVLGHPSYYPRFGFTRASDHGIAMNVEVPDDALMALSLNPAATLPGGKIRYAKAFGDI
ncbi:GNAT family N-acetyltransferase [Nocardia sp. NPDC057668]|uniref:GNAT family N-acetyltransferase n=1 Tax=Nocardia sp. NPDC057668 TaxID=3346202 RepID=UPI003672D13A